MSKILVLLAIGFLPAISAFAADEPYKMPEENTSEAVPVPSDVPEQVIGFYSNGCILGATPFDVSNKNWEIANTRRNHQYGHSSLIRFTEKLGEQSVKHGFGKLFVGDSSCAGGGKMHEGHASHRVGLDVDIFYRFIPPDKKLSLEESNSWSEEEQVKSEIAKYDPPEKYGEPMKAFLNPEKYKDDYMKLVRLAAIAPDVERIFVSPAIKKKLCELYYKENFKTSEEDPRWLKKIRPLGGHKSHFHVRLKCPADSPMCKPQTPVEIDPKDTTKVGCAGPDLNDWFTYTKSEEEKKVTKPKPDFQIRCEEERAKIQTIKLSEFIRCLRPVAPDATTLKCRDYRNARNFAQSIRCPVAEVEKNLAKCLMGTTPTDRVDKTRVLR